MGLIMSRSQNIFLIIKIFNIYSYIQFVEFFIKINYLGKDNLIEE